MHSPQGTRRDALLQHVSRSCSFNIFFSMYRLRFHLCHVSPLHIPSVCLLLCTRFWLNIEQIQPSLTSYTISNLLSLVRFWWTFQFLWHQGGASSKSWKCSIYGLFSLEFCRRVNNSLNLQKAPSFLFDFGLAFSFWSGVGGCNNPRFRSTSLRGLRGLLTRHLIFWWNSV